MSKGEGKKIAIKFTEKLVGDVAGNSLAFIVTGNEPKYIGGPTIPKNYTVASVEYHPEFVDSKTLLLTMTTNKDFKNVEGLLKVNYDKSKGTLAGSAGFVESFETMFLPIDLEPKLDPSVSEKFIVTPTATIDFNKVVYNDRYVNEKFVMSANCTINFEYVGVINP